MVKNVFVMLSLEYIAGFVDGEGAFFFGVGGGITPHVTVSNCYRPVLEEIHQMFGGHIHTLQSINAPLYQLDFTKLEEAKRLIETLLPHLIVKRQAATWLLEYIETRLQTINQTSSRHPEFTLHELELVKVFMERTGSFGVQYSDILKRIERKSLGAKNIYSVRN